METIPSVHGIVSAKRDLTTMHACSVGLTIQQSVLHAVRTACPHCDATRSKSSALSPDCSNAKGNAGGFDACIATTYGRAE